MKPSAFLGELAAFLFLLVVVNAFALPSVVLFHRSDASLVESLQAQDELRYLGKIKEASEDRWLMSNPVLKEHHGSAFSPSGFIEWVPAVILRAVGNDMGLMLFLTDILCTAAVILLTRFWLSSFIRSRIVMWTVLFLLCTTAYGGSLNGLLRDTAPKFTQILFSLYLLLLTLPPRDQWERILLRSALIGVMFYTYPYHWTLAFVTEGVFLLSRIVLTAPSWSPKSLVVSTLRLWLPILTTIVPFAVIASPLALAMRGMLSRPEYADFYARYHIAYSHVPAAPALQLVLLAALSILGLTVWYLVKKRRESVVEIFDGLTPLIFPLVAMLVLLNSNVLTGKDPEWLGHGGLTILPLVTAVYAVVLTRLLPQKYLVPVASVVCVLAIGIAANHGYAHWTTQNAVYAAWENSDEKKVLTWLDIELPSGRVIAAPSAIAERIPVLTSHDVTFSDAAHFFFVPTDELTDRYLGWVGLFPEEKEPTDTGTVAIFGNYPGAQWAKERTWNKLLSRPFTKTMADYIPRQDLRTQIDKEHASPNAALTAERFAKYGAEVLVAVSDVPRSITKGMTLQTTIGRYRIWVKNGL